MSSPLRGLDKKLLFIGCVGLLGLGVGLVWELGGLKARRGRIGVPELSPTRLPELRLPAVLPSAPKQARPGKPAVPDSLTFAELVTILSAYGSLPPARRFSLDFEADQALSGLWENFHRTDDVEAFRLGLQRSGSFGRLLARHGRDAEFRRIAEELANHDRLAPHMEELQLRKAARRGGGLAPETEPEPSAPVEEAQQEETRKHLMSQTLRNLVSHLLDRRLWGLSYGLDAQERSVLLKGIGALKSGESPWNVCAAAGLVRECSALVRRCMDLPGCVNLLNSFEPTGVRSVSPIARECGDGTCETLEGENCELCYADCGTCLPPRSCGDGRCDPAETCVSCALDCGSCKTAGPRCGDGRCNGRDGEDCLLCPGDCGVCRTSCGNTFCEPPGEDCVSCGSDCCPEALATVGPIPGPPPRPSKPVEVPPLGEGRRSPKSAQAAGCSCGDWGPSRCTCDTEGCLRCRFRKCLPPGCQREDDCTEISSCAP